MRYLIVGLAGAIGAITLSAGPVTIGSGTNGVNGLTASYVTGATSASCSGAQLAQAGFTNCFTNSGNPTGDGAGGLKAYNTVLFVSANPTPAPTVATTSAPASINKTLDGSTTFAMIAGNSAGTQNYWATTGTNTVSSITIPIGISNVDKVWTMLNDYWGPAGSTTEVDFGFSSSSDGSSGIAYDAITLINGVDIRAALDCTGPTPSACPISTTGAGDTNGAIVTTLTAGPTVVGDASVYASNVYSSGYTSVQAGTAYAGTSGNVELDAQAFDFGNAHYGQWLVDIVVKNTDSNLNYSRDALSAITVDAGGATPEPTTLLMLGGGLAAIGLLRKRRRA